MLRRGSICEVCAKRFDARVDSRPNSGRTCSRACAASLKSTTHGHSHRINGKKVRTPTYLSWQTMKARCLYPREPGYPRYGGRGITVCKRWMSFANFLEDMGERPIGTSLDRIDNDGHYEPSNVRWATREEQNNNRRNTKFIEFQGRRLGVAQWARYLGIDRTTIGRRIERGCSVEEILSTKNLYANGRPLRHSS
jgi:hypothetical protein